MLTDDLIPVHCERRRRNVQCQARDWRGTGPGAVSCRQPITPGLSGLTLGPAFPSTSSTFTNAARRARLATLIACPITPAIMSQPSITNFIVKRPWLKRWMTPLANWYTDAAGYRKLGLRYDNTDSHDMHCPYLPSRIAIVLITDWR